MTTEEEYHDAFMRRAFEREAKAAQDHEDEVRASLDAASALLSGREQRQLDQHQRAQSEWARRRDELQRSVDEARAVRDEARSQMSAARARGDIAAAAEASVRVPGLDLLVTETEAALDSHRDGQPR